MRRRNILLGTLAIAVVMATIGGIVYALHTRTQAPADALHTRTQGDGKSYPGLHAPVFIVCPGPPYGTIGQGPFQGPPYRAAQGAPVSGPPNDGPPPSPQKHCRDSVPRPAVRAFL